MAKRKALLAAAFLTAVPGTFFMTTQVAASPPDRRLCDDYRLASPPLPDEACRSRGGTYHS